MPTDDAAPATAAAQAVGGPGPEPVQVGFRLYPVDGTAEFPPLSSGPDLVNPPAYTAVAPSRVAPPWNAPDPPRPPAASPVGPVSTPRRPRWRAAIIIGLAVAGMAVIGLANFTIGEGTFEGFPEPPGRTYVVYDGARLDGADFSNEDLTGASFVDAQLRAADFSNATLSGATFWRARLDIADFMNAELDGSDLSPVSAVGADFSNAELSNTQLAGGDFTKADFANATMTEADLTGASLNGADLSNANLAGAHLAGADFSNADLSNIDLDGAEYDDTTQWPRGFDVPREAIRI